MRIYTKTGDSGQTGLVGGARIPKNSARIEAIGAVDELNAAIGVARADAEGSSLAAELSRVQNWLFDLGAELATPIDKGGLHRAESKAHAQHLERSIDAQSANLPVLRNFILPGGSRLAASLHFARCVCRRAERQVLSLHAKEAQREETLVFLNRLSDWIFVAARTANAEARVKDIEWKSEG